MAEGFESLAARHGRVSQLLFLPDFEDHVRQAGRHVSMTEVLAVLAISPRFFDNEGENRSAPALMLGPTSMGRILKVPIAPTESWGCWIVLTAYDAGAEDKVRYQGGT